MISNQMFIPTNWPLYCYWIVDDSRWGLQIEVSIMLLLDISCTTGNIYERHVYEAKIKKIAKFCISCRNDRNFKRLSVDILKKTRYLLIKSAFRPVVTAPLTSNKFLSLGTFNFQYRELDFKVGASICFLRLQAPRRF